MLDQEIKLDTPTGKKITELYENGQLVPDEIVVQLIERKLADSKDIKGFIFKGFPRTLVQSYILDGLLKKHGSFISDFSSTEIKNLTLESYQENQVAKINAEIYSSESDSKVYVYFKKTSWRDYQKELMTVKDDFNFEYVLPHQVNKDGFLEYFISVEKGKDILTFPGKINSSPNNWDFNSQEKYQLKILPVSDKITICLLYTSDAADERSSVDLGGRRIIKKKNTLVVRAVLHLQDDRTSTYTETTAAQEMS